MRFEVFMTTAAKQRISEQAEWIATEQAGPHVAAAWLTRIVGTIDELEEMPYRYPVASEDAWCDYEVRQVTIGQYLLFITILEDTQAVWVIHARHGRQLTRPDDLPDDVGSLDERA
jgi:plasmid stabilization system protein ParE